MKAYIWQFDRDQMRALFTQMTWEEISQGKILRCGYKDTQDTYFVAK